MKFHPVVAVLFTGLLSLLSAQEAPMGSAVSPEPKEKAALDAIKGKVKGMIVWSSSRSNSKHDLWLMNADGTGQHQLTKGDQVDWFPRFSPDGRTILFVRSKGGWESEGDANINDKWDVWNVSPAGGDEKLVAADACWGTWRPGGDSIVFARGPKVFIKCLADGNEKELFDAEKSVKKGVMAQQPSLSPDGRLLAITLRGTKRDCGIWNLAKNEWYTTDGGCEITFFPSGKRVLRVNEGQGNGGTEVLAIAIDADGKPVEKIGSMGGLNDKIRFMDLPGRRSHEYFPKIDPSGTWMVWGATQYGHEHDLADYEIYLWNITTDKNRDFTRLTFHTGNDRWPDIFIGEPKAPASDTRSAPDSGSAK